MGLTRDAIAFNQARLAAMELARPIEVAPKNGDCIVLQDAGPRRPTAGFNSTEPRSEFLQHTGHGSPVTLLARPIVNVCCFLMLLSQTTKQNKHRNDLSLV